jgi:hypothetical protein
VSVPVYKKIELSVVILVSNKVDDREVEQHYNSFKGGIKTIRECQILSHKEHTENIYNRGDI